MSESIRGLVYDNVDLLYDGHDASMVFTPDDNMAGDEPLPNPLPSRSSRPATANPASASSSHDSGPTVAGTAVLGAACEDGAGSGHVIVDHESVRAGVAEVAGGRPVRDDTMTGQVTYPASAMDDEDDVMYDGHDTRVIFTPDAENEPLPNPQSSRSPSPVATNPALTSSQHDSAPTVCAGSGHVIDDEDDVMYDGHDARVIFTPDAENEPLPNPQSSHSPSTVATNPALTSSQHDSAPTVAETAVSGVASEDRAGLGDVHVRTGSVRATVTEVAGGSPYRTPHRRAIRTTQRDGNTLAFRRNPPYADIWSSSACMNTFLHSR
jgi:hypothetical protein